MIAALLRDIAPKAMFAAGVVLGSSHLRRHVRLHSSKWYGSQLSQKDWVAVLSEAEAAEIVYAVEHVMHKYKQQQESLELFLARMSTEDFPLPNLGKKKRF